MVRHNYIRGKILPALIALSGLLTCWSCGGSDLEEPQTAGMVTLKLVLPQADDEVDLAPRSGASATGVGDENKISNLKFFIYSIVSGVSTLEAYKSIEITVAPDGTWNCPDPMWDASNKTLRITVTQGTKNIYCVANWSDVTAEGMPLLDNTTAITETALTGFTRSHLVASVGITPALPPVMTGSLPSQYIVGNETTPLSINLRRQIARVELEFRLSDVLSAVPAATVTIEGVKFFNLPSASYLFPRTTTTSPPGITLWPQTAYIGTGTGTGTGTAIPVASTVTPVVYATKYYIPEYVPAGTSAAAEMVIKATYNGADTYYSIVIDPSLNTSYSHSAYVIERNHTYKYAIVINGAGGGVRSTDGSRSANISYTLEIK